MRVFHPERDITVVVHGDDFAALATDPELDWYTAEFQKAFEIKVRGRMGEGTEEWEIRILNRIVRITPEGIRFEADPRHHELIARSLGLENGTFVFTPGTKPVAEETYTFKGEKGEVTGHVQDVTGRMCEASTDATGSIQIQATEDDSTIRAISLRDIIDGTVTTDNTGNEAVELMAVLLQNCRSKSCLRKNGARADAKIVRLADTPIETCEIIGYEHIYGQHPPTIFAFSDGTFKTPKNIVDPYTGKTSEVMCVRIKQYGRDLLSSRAQICHLTNSEGIQFYDRCN